MDWSITHALNNFFWHHDALEDPLLTYVQAAEGLFLGMLVLTCLLARHDRWAGVRRAAVAAGLSAGLGLLVAKLITEIYDRPRPFVAHPGSVHLFAPHVPDASFPSDHATAAFAIAAAILLRSKPRWGAITLAFALILLVGRVALGYHYPTDVLGGAMIGTLAAVVLAWPPIGRLVDGLSDTVGGYWDRASDAALRRLLPRAVGRQP